MKKLIYLIIAITVLGLIVSGCIPVVPPTEQNETGSLMRGDTITVNYDGTGNYTTIQAAINAAIAGDTIIVAAGTYNENINIDKSLTVVSAGGPDVTTINAQTISFAVLINGASTVATFDGFTVENYQRAGILAGAFSLENDPVEVHILNNIVEGALGQQNNNCIQIGDGTTGTVIGNEVSGAFLDSPDWTGSGILVAGSSNVVVSNNYAHDCESGIVIAGYAVYRNAPAENNLVENNLVEDNGCGISVQMNSIGTIIRYNDVLNNNDVGIGSVGNIVWEPNIPSGTEIHYNNIVGNVNYGVQSSVWDSTLGAPEQVDATYNWWGHPGGPRRPAGNSGQISGPKAADQVSENVLYHPWLNGANSVSNIALNQTATASLALLSNPATMAVDGNYNTLWNAGAHPPQWIEIDLGKGSTVVGLRLLTAQSPNCVTTHVVLFSDDGGVIADRTFSGDTETEQWLEAWFDASLQGVKTLRVTTTTSDSWVAWYEIEIYGWQ